MKKYLVVTLLLLSTVIVKAQTPEDVVKASLSAYNEKNIDEFMSFFSEDITLHDFNRGELRAKGLDEIRSIFEAFFKKSPELHSKIVNRITFDNKVIDHESITGAGENKDSFEVTMIYEIKDQKIVKMTSIHKTR